MLYGVLSSAAEYEREMTRERVTAGMAAAKRAGIHVRRRLSLRPEHVADARTKLADGQPARAVARFLGVSEATLHRALARYPEVSKTPA
jgi:DNA invertase Pin-like site-specific DNA recombinase